jgi:hypothetical protein
MEDSLRGLLVIANVSAQMDIMVIIVKMAQAAHL